MRSARVERKTKESHVVVELELDGTGEINVDTGLPFFDHMLSQLGKHSGFNLTVKTTGDVAVDSHHSVEDTSLAFGQALREALGDKVGIRRFGDAMVPLDEVLVQAAVDLSGRPYLLEGRNAHHVLEAQFKCVARALRDAVALDGVSGVPSTKGVL